MTDNATKSDDSGLDQAHYVELSEIELSCIGHIVAQWGALEYEIFLQTLQTFGKQATALPKVMNNMQFSGVLELWKERVVDQCNGEKKKNLENSILLFITTMTIEMHWCMECGIRTDLLRLKSKLRIRKTEVISTHFTVSDLQDFSLAVAKINFSIRYPRGDEDLAELLNKGGHIGRLATSLFCQAVEAKPDSHD